MNIQHQADLLKESRPWKSAKVMHEIPIDPLRGDDGKRTVPTVAAGDQRWLDGLLTQGRAAVVPLIVDITPGRAAALLKRNPKNRELKERRIVEIADDIVNGRWDLNGETIIMSDDGLLNDGQNRLWACIEAGKSIKTAMVIGAARDSRLSVDQGTARTSADFLKMDNGTQSPQVAAAAARILWLYKQRRMTDGGDIVITKAMIRAEYQASEASIDAAIVKVSKGKHKALKGGPLVAAYVILSKINQSAADMFFDRLIKGEGGSTDPIFVLRESLMATGRDVGPCGRLEMVLRHWNAWRKGKKLTNQRRLPVQKSYPEALEY